MDAVNQESRCDVAYRILESWGLNAQQRRQLLDSEESILAILSIRDSLCAIFQGDKERGRHWLARPNKAFDGASALEVMLGGDCEKVRKYLRYHVYNA